MVIKMKSRSQLLLKICKILKEWFRIIYEDIYQYKDDHIIDLPNVQFQFHMGSMR